MPHDLFKFSERITALPVIHGSGDFAVEVRRVMLEEKFDCLAVPLPPSFKHNLEQAISSLPVITLVAQAEPTELDGEEESEGRMNFVPVDPCQPVIAAIRVAMGDRLRRAYIDLEVEHFVAYSGGFPDPYALKKLPLEKYVAAILPAIPRPPKGQPRRRIAHMAQRLIQLEKKHQSILMVCSLLDWPWIREAYNQGKATKAQSDEATKDEQMEVAQTEIYQPEEKNLLFCLGELPFITGLYERARADLDDDENLSIDGVKELLITARDRYKDDLKKQARPITPKLLALLMKYIRNLSLVERRLTPDLYTLVVSSQQVAGDQYALHVVETSRTYPFNGKTEYPVIGLGIDRARLPSGDVVTTVNRLAGPPMTWRSLELKKRPDRAQQKLWQMRWNPFRQCSWPPEDVAIERFRTHTFEKAKQIIGQDLARVEKFTTSVQDGIDIRETLRNWHTGDLYVKIFPPNRGSLDAILMLFDSPADPRDYPYRVTWHHEHSEESTLSFFATDWRKNVIGPGIAQALYGGAMMIFPPIEPHIFDIWQDPFFDRADTMEERLLMGTCWYSREKHIALLSAAAPGAAFRKIAKSFGKKLVHLPMSHFSASTVQQLRVVHVLNGHQVRSYAAEFIRKA